MLESINKLVYGMRVHTEMPGGECHRHEKWFGKEMMRFGISVTFGLFGMDASADVQTNYSSSSAHMHSGFPAKLIEQMIVTSLYDVTRFSHATEGGNYKRRA